MGRAACHALAQTDDLQLAGGIDLDHAGEPLARVLGLPGDAGLLFNDPGACYDAAKPAVVVDFSVYPATLAMAEAAVIRGISPVIGATGRTAADEATLAHLCAQRGVPGALVPNFALGAVLMMRFAAEAARYFPTAEIVELHHDAKIDAPSGTAKLTAARMAAASGREVPIHSVRLRGLVAHQEVLLGGDGETLTLRHDSLSRDSFMRGVLLAVRAVRSRTGLVVGLEALMENAVPA
jgi:4-hydroxy-tetrahydrodipicolinate reductase